MIRKVFRMLFDRKAYKREMFEKELDKYVKENGYRLGKVNSYSRKGMSAIFSYWGCVNNTRQYFLLNILNLDKITSEIRANSLKNSLASFVSKYSDKLDTKDIQTRILPKYVSAYCVCDVGDVDLFHFDVSDKVTKIHYNPIVDKNDISKIVDAFLTIIGKNDSKKEYVEHDTKCTNYEIDHIIPLNPKPLS